MKRKSTANFFVSKVRRLRKFNFGASQLFSCPSPRPHATTLLVSRPPHDAPGFLSREVWILHADRVAESLCAQRLRTLKTCEVRPTRRPFTLSCMPTGMGFSFFGIVGWFLELPRASRVVLSNGWMACSQRQSGCLRVVKRVCVYFGWVGGVEAKWGATFSHCTSLFFFFGGFFPLPFAKSSLRTRSLDLDVRIPATPRDRLRRPPFGLPSCPVPAF